MLHSVSNKMNSAENRGKYPKGWQKYVCVHSDLTVMYSGFPQGGGSEHEAEIVIYRVLQQGRI